MVSFNDKELTEFHQFMERKFHADSPQKTKRGLVGVGKQPNGNEWVLNPKVHISADGTLIPLLESHYAWQPIGGPCIKLAMKGQTGSAINLESDIQLPLESADALHLLLTRMKDVFKHNFIASKCIQ